MILKVAEISEIAPNTAKMIEVAGKKIALFNREGEFFAVDDACPHRGAPLSDGTLDGDFVVCPWHAARFNIKTGEASGPPAPKGVNTYPVTIENSIVYLELL